jgi:NAD+ diphosphatase
MSRTHTFAGSPLDRASHRRSDADWLRDRLRDPLTRVIPLWQLKPLVIEVADQGLEAAWQPPEAVQEHVASGAEVIFLGVVEGVAYFAVDVPSAEGPEPEGPLAGRGQFLDLRAAAAQLPAGDSAILAQAKALLGWHAHHRFCSACGSETISTEAGYVRQCARETCKVQHFPRTDPVVIMLALRGDRCLVGRQPAFARGVYSALAGFMEPGETIEEAVRREVMEEAGVRVSGVRYHSTQPWPFPSSLMIGCFADAETEEIVLGPSELEEARWVPRDLLRAVLGGAKDLGIRVPPPLAIAHQLMRAWVEEE